eukprot:CAMPEP_0174304566 /NCGR_PEP_ID=MMETSP0809-20121228/60868_1 /TAXON_ID=73025 ORGANISM="Eutreptiella gymnastica-like, Strain CCMP1594" /NCGR_SAMPLE_ID=MMETSP0809 /ASSEMBLY_ACC=CAM_ASM_000658 /LENGTH=47 /DNA_ID= /DNA_START= /DNA_END= /DNA_ORIENTATION=
MVFSRGFTAGGLVAGDMLPIAPLGPPCGAAGGAGMPYVGLGPICAPM